MTEKLLHYIWLFQCFQTSPLFTTDGQLLQVRFTGSYNQHQGPDFLDAKIKIADTVWVGSVEIHILASDWALHQHGTDKNYRNVILHVVWEEDTQLSLGFPTLELKTLVPKHLIRRYEMLQQDQPFIPCEKQIKEINPIIFEKWKERLLVERLQKKAAHIAHLLDLSNGHWEEVCWWMLARNFGMRVNADAFEAIARSISFPILLRHRHSLMQIEALLLGQGGLLQDPFTEAYPLQLKQEYQHLQRKYQLRSCEIPLYFLRMRPANFPSLRLAQLAALFHREGTILSKFLTATDTRSVEKMLQISPSEYWFTHYLLEEVSEPKKKSLGRQMLVHLIINAVIPMMYAVGSIKGETQFLDKSLQWLAELPPEKNTISQGFAKLGFPHAHAFDSQAYLQLKQEYCNQKRCLECSVGNFILKLDD